MRAFVSLPVVPVGAPEHSALVPALHYRNSSCSDEGVPRRVAPVALQDEPLLLLAPRRHQRPVAL